MSANLCSFLIAEAGTGNMVHLYTSICSSVLNDIKYQLFSEFDDCNAMAGVVLVLMSLVFAG